MDVREEKMENMPLDINQLVKQLNIDPSKLTLPKGFNLADLRRRWIEEWDELVFMDGRRVSPEQMADELISYIPKYPIPMLFLKSDFDLISVFKMRYLYFSYNSRMCEERKKGMSFVPRGQPAEIIYAAGAKPVDVFFWINEVIFTGDFYFTERGHELTSPEACHAECGLTAMIEEGAIPADLVALPCNFISGDTAACHLLHRSGKKGIPLLFTDFPVNGIGKRWATKYLAEGFRNLAERVAHISGKGITEEGLRQWIRIINEGRRQLREFKELCLFSERPPVASCENMIVIGGLLDWFLDPLATIATLKEVNCEVRKRVEKGIQAPGLSEEPVRLFMLSMPSADMALLNVVDDLGGVIVWCELTSAFCDKDVVEDGDPYEQLANWWIKDMSWSPSVSLRDRTERIMELLEKGRIDGVIFNCNWGCNWQPPFAKAIIDTIKEEMGIPGLIITTGMPRKDGAGGYKLSAQLQTRIEAFIEMLK